MTSRIKVTPPKEKYAGEGGSRDPPDRALLDLSDAAVKELIRSAKKRGYVTHDQINALLSSEDVKSEQIEEVLATFSATGISVVETKETEPEEEVATGEEPEPTPEELAEKLHMPLEKVRKTLKIAKEPVSLETPIGEEGTPNSAT